MSSSRVGQWAVRAVPHVGSPHRAVICHHAVLTTIPAPTSTTTLKPVVLENVSAASDLPITTARFVSLDPNGLYTVAGRLLCEAPADLVFKLLQEVENSHKVYHNILDSNMKVDDCGESVLVQTCQWTFGPFSGTFLTSMRVEERSEQMELSFVLKESSFMQDFEGKWKVTPAVLSGSDPECWTQACIIDHQLSVKPSVVPPGPFAEMMQGVFVTQVTRIMDDLLQEILRRQGKDDLF